MWQVLLLTLISVGFVRSDTNCPGWSIYQHDPTLLSKLNGEYQVIYTTSYAIDCERFSWTLGSTNNRTAYLKDAEGCSRRIDNFNLSNPDYYELDMTPLSTCIHLPSTERLSGKIIRSSADSTNLCLFIYFCRPSRYGLSVYCRQKPQLTLLTTILQILLELISLVLPIPVFKTVKQSSCNFTNTSFF